METSPLPVKGCKFCPIAFMAIEQWGFFSVPHLLWQGQTVYNGHLRGPVTLTLVAERLAVQLSLPISITMLRSVGTAIRTPNLLHARRALKPTVSLPGLEYFVGVHLHVLHGLSLCYNMLVERYFFCLLSKKLKFNDFWKYDFSYFNNHEIDITSWSFNVRIEIYAPGNIEKESIAEIRGIISFW